jgi:hypothetical protein
VIWRSDCFNWCRVPYQLLMDLPFLYHQSDWFEDVAGSISVVALIGLEDRCLSEM